MSEENNSNPIAIGKQALTAQLLLEVLLRFTVVILLVYICYKIFAPFMALLAWGLIMAVALYPVQQKLSAKLDGRSGRASLILVLGILITLGGPILLLGGSFFDQLQSIHSTYEAGELKLSPPSESVANWPVVGPRVHAAWSQAASDMPHFLEDHRSALKRLSERLVSMSMSGMKSVLLLIGAFILAGIIMAFAKDGILALTRIFDRVASSDGEAIQKLCTGTIRSVAVGVLGVALIQALLFGVGFVVCGIPAAGLLALFVMFTAIIQIPSLLIGLPVIAYVWVGGDGSTVVNVLFTVWFLFASLADNFLKPMLLGRGVDAPMPIILIGALGGMVVAGFIGLFVGAVFLAVGYQVFMQWVHNPIVDRGCAD